MSSFKLILLSVFCLALCMSDLMQAACLPARLPSEGDMEEGSKSRSSGSSSSAGPQMQCNSDNVLDAAQLSVLKSRADNDLGAVMGNMTLAKHILDMQVNESDSDDLPTGFYGGKESNDHTQIANSITFMCCAVPYILDVMKQEAVNDEVLGVSSYFHAVYDILDPADNSNLPTTLKNIVIGAELNACHVPDGSICQQLLTESHSAVIFASIVAQNLMNLSADTMSSLIPALG